MAQAGGSGGAEGGRGGGAVWPSAEPPPSEWRASRAGSGTQVWPKLMGKSLAARPPDTSTQNVDLTTSESEWARAQAWASAEGGAGGHRRRGNHRRRHGQRHGPGPGHRHGPAGAVREGTANQTTAPPPMKEGTPRRVLGHIRGKWLALTTPLQPLQGWAYGGGAGPAGALLLFAMAHASGQLHSARRARTAYGTPSGERPVSSGRPVAERAHKRGGEHPLPVHRE